MNVNGKNKVDKVANVEWDSEVADDTNGIF
jgi:hypothetical protein